MKGTAARRTTTPHLTRRVALTVFHSASANATTSNTMVTCTDVATLYQGGAIAKNTTNRRYGRR